jgi:hypothetical protein
MGRFSKLIFTDSAVAAIAVVSAVTDIGPNAAAATRSGTDCCFVFF